MRTPALVASIATAGLVVAVSGVVAALVVDEDESPRDRVPTAAASPAATPAEPPASVRPSATSVLTPAPTAPTTRPAAVPTTTTAPSTPAPRQTTPATTPTRTSPTSVPPAPPRGGRTYVVRPGDTLSEIAEWFRLMGFERLYERNRDVIGSDPDLIKPGQRFTISATGALVMSRG